MQTRQKTPERDEHLEDWVLLSALKQRAEEMFRDSLLATGSPQHAVRETERFLEGNAVFEIDGDGSFEATVGTNSGIKFFSGVHPESVSDQAAATCHALEKQIRRAYSALPPVEALREIGTVWNMAERTCELAAARSRLLLGKLPSLPLVDLPEWFVEAHEEWDNEDRESVSPASLAAAGRIVQCIAAELPELTAELSVGMLGRIVMDWHNLPVRCSWMIDPTDLPFPAVRIFQARQSPENKLRTSVIHDMHMGLETLRGIANGTDVI